MEEGNDKSHKFEFSEHKLRSSWACKNSRGSNKHSKGVSEFFPDRKTSLAQCYHGDGETGALIRMYYRRTTDYGLQVHSFP